MLDTRPMVPLPEQDAPDAARPRLHFRTIWVSDLHLGTRGAQVEQFLDFMRNTSSDFFYLVGDVVDGWQLRKHWHWPQAHNDVVQKILKRARHGTSVFFLPGNHDEAARDFCGLRFGGVLVENELVHETADGRRLLVLHGDQFDSVMGYAKWLAQLGDMAYQVALGVNVVFNFIRRKLGFSYWSLSAYLKRKVKNAVEFISAYEDFIADEARRHGVNGVVCGHIHHAEVRKIGGYDYYNDGDWVESCTALVEDETGKIFVIDWPRQKDELLKKLMPDVGALAPQPCAS